MSRQRFGTRTPGFERRETRVEHHRGARRPRPRIREGLEEVGGAVEFYRGAAPLELPHTLSRPSTLLRATLSLSKGRAPLRRRAPFAWLARTLARGRRPASFEVGSTQTERRRQFVVFSVSSRSLGWSRSGTECRSGCCGRAGAPTGAARCRHSSRSPPPRSAC